jgi:hypothetical protein
MDYRKASELFWVTFTGEFVELLCKYETSQRMPLVIQGYMLDIDQDYYYIGANALEVSSAIRKTDVAYIQILKEADPTLEVLENMPMPDDEHDAN